MRKRLCGHWRRKPPDTGKNLRMLLGAKLALPTIPADQRIRFMPLPAKAVRVLGLRSVKPRFVMELRSYTLRARALYYQCIYAEPFSEKLVILDKP
jgi:GntR family transcriptional regulator